MPVPSYRVPVKVARGTYANLLANVASLEEGEVCYANDQNALYVVEGGVLTQASADLSAASIDALADVDTSTVAPGDGQTLVWSEADGEWQPGTIQSGVTSVNGETGAVILEIQDLDNVSHPQTNTTFDGTWAQITNLSTTSDGLMASDITGAMRFAITSGGVNTLSAWQDWSQRVLGVTFPGSAGTSVAISPSVEIVINRDGIDYTLACDTIWNRNEGT